MKTRINILLQCIVPQHSITRVMGYLAQVRNPWFKNLFIAWFIKKYGVDMSEAAIEDYRAYPTFNDFFIRKLKDNARPIAGDARTVVSPADGAVAQLGTISGDQLLQAKGHYFDLTSLLTDKTLAQTFNDGRFATIYLAPFNYHCVHMPLDGRLVKTIYVPGKLFSVNKITAENIPNLYSRNERFICIFESAAGRFALIFVGAMIVGGMQMAWMNEPVRSYDILTQDFSTPIEIAKGAEIGHFKLGSTVILLFEKNQIEWEANLQAGSVVQVGQRLA